MNTRRWTSGRRRQPVLGFVGIHAGRRTDQPISQNETLALLFEKSGYSVRRTSAVKRPSLRTAHQILSLLTWRGVDVVVIAVFSGPSFWIADFSSLICRLRGQRMVMFLHGGNLPVYGPQHRRRVERVLSRADRIYAPSQFLADAFRDWGLDVGVIPNVLAIEQYVYTERSAARPRLLWMRTFHEHYDPLTAVRVLARVREEYPEATMTMAGADHGLLSATVAEAERLGVAGAIEFPGYILPPDKVTAFADHDLFLNTNVVDNMPVSVLEVAAAGIVPVATEVGGIPALLTDGHDSVLVPAGDDEAMAGAVVDLLGDPERYAALARNARTLALRSSWPEVRARWEEELRLVLPGCSLP